VQVVKTIGLDISKSGFQVHGVDADGQVVFRRARCRGMRPTRIGSARSSGPGRQRGSARSSGSARLQIAFEHLPAVAVCSTC
jgi:hypothetical protein